MSKPLVWAHRGASGYAPENTLPAFQKAADLGADGVELDVQLTKDGEIVVCHDEQIDRTASAKGWIKDYTLEELRKMDFCCGQMAYEGVQIPTMQEVFDLLKPTGLTINIELKTGEIFYPELERRIVELTRENGWMDRVIFSSFNHYSIMEIQKLAPEAKTGFLYADGTLDMPEYGRDHHVNALHPALYNLQYPNYMKKCREFGLDVNVWTVNRDEWLKMCCGFGVHAIITNYPDKARKIIDD